MSTTALRNIPSSPTAVIPILGTPSSVRTTWLQGGHNALIILGEVNASDEYEGYEPFQFEKAFEQAAPQIASRAKEAKSRGSVGIEATRKLMEAALNAES